MSKFTELQEAKAAAAVRVKNAALSDRLLADRLRQAIAHHLGVAAGHVHVVPDKSFVDAETGHVTTAAAPFGGTGGPKTALLALTLDDATITFPFTFTYDPAKQDNQIATARHHAHTFSATRELEQFAEHVFAAAMRHFADCRKLGRVVEL